jgi:hypothetical protein
VGREVSGFWIGKVGAPASCPLDQLGVDRPRTATAWLIGRISAFFDAEVCAGDTSQDGTIVTRL